MGAVAVEDLARAHVDTVADAAERLALDLYEGKLPVTARKSLIDAAQESAGMPVSGGINGVVIVAQARSILVDLLQLTGLDYVEARDLVP